MLGHDTNLATLQAYLTARLGDSLLIAQRTEQGPAAFKRPADFDEFALLHALPVDVPIDELGRQALDSGRAIGWPLEDARCLCVAVVQVQARTQVFIISVQDVHPLQGCRLLRLAAEAWGMTKEVEENRRGLSESAAQLGHLFEEQSWLRDIARNAADLARTHNAVELANHILEPLVYLLKTQDLFLIVDPQETACIGLTDRKYGDSLLSTAAVRRLLAGLSFTRDSAAIVKNNARFVTADGLVKSIVAVPIHSSRHFLGCLVAINRLSTETANETTAHNPEFGSDEVGLLEEAAVLLATQALNIHLLKQSNQLLLGTLHAMSNAIDARDHYTQGHSERVATLAHSLARIYGLSENACQEVYLAGILHDIGKIGVPDAVLLKNGPLTAEEFKVIQTHPEIGYRIVEKLEHLQFVLPGILYHHERWDGRGYPHGLSGALIPLMARILAVADAFDAMTSSRPYRNAMPPEKAYQIISNGAAEQWDALVVECLKTWYAEHVTSTDRLQTSSEPLIPLGSPVEYISQAILSLGY